LHAIISNKTFKLFDEAFNGYYRLPFVRASLAEPLAPCGRIG